MDYLSKKTAQRPASMWRRGSVWLVHGTRGERLVFGTEKEARQYVQSQKDAEQLGLEKQLRSIHRKIAAIYRAEPEDLEALNKRLAPLRAEQNEVLAQLWSRYGILGGAE